MSTSRILPPLCSRVAIAAMAMGMAIACVLPADEAQALEGPHLVVSPYGGYAAWNPVGGLAEQAILGGRLGVMATSWLGIEGTYGVSFTEDPADASRDVRVTHVGADLLVQPRPDWLVSPYLLGGWGQISPDPEGPQSARNHSGVEVAAGVMIRLAEGDGYRLGLRIEARDVIARFDRRPPDPNDPLHHALFTAGVRLGVGRGPSRDTDGDGVFDPQDECPQTPLGALVDGRGCPSDGDGDGVVDGLDVCPATAAGAVVDRRGCPRDGDGDGVPDGIDQCPATVARVVVDARGCAVDRDADGVADGLDQCPGTPADTPVDDTGCPLPEPEPFIEPEPVERSPVETALLDTGLLSLDSVFFRSGSWTLLPESSEALDEVGEILSRWPQLEVEVGGHTDSQGDDAFNRELSLMRAHVVLDYLVSEWKVAPDQFEVKGYGEEAPIADNATEDGRRRNRRVEFRVLNREVLRQER